MYCLLVEITEINGSNVAITKQAMSGSNGRNVGVNQIVKCSL